MSGASNEAANIKSNIQQVAVRMEKCIEEDNFGGVYVG